MKGWNKFRQLVPLRTNKGVSLLMRRKLHAKVVCYMALKLGW